MFPHCCVERTVGQTLQVTVLNAQRGLRTGLNLNLIPQHNTTNECRQNLCWKGANMT